MRWFLTPWWKLPLFALAAAAGFALWHFMGPELTAVGIVGTLAGMLLGKHKMKSIRRNAAEARLEDAVALGQMSIAEAERKANEEVEDGMAEHGTLGSYLNDRAGDD